MSADRVEILLVEDRRAEVEMALFAFEKCGIRDRVRVARDGAEALEFVFGGASGPDGSGVTGLKLILLDLKLPKVDGLEVLHRIKSDKATRRVPVVIMTTSNEARDICDAYDLGANGYLVKPMNFDQLLSALSTVVTFWLDLNRVP